jgi:hypothetical protein
VDPLDALDAFGTEGPSLRRWEARVVTELRHGSNSALIAWTDFAFFTAMTPLCAVLAVWSTLGDASGWQLMLLWLATAAAGVMTSITFRWARWLSARRHQPGHGRR